ncbi:MAG: hypothetical protein MRJ67_10520 [Nitrospirales bacterium]|nr:hypothetical protein [Nitrospirales bacterium]MDR4481753.1 hypothetical protein [Nitrospirales bacterium]
MAKRRSLQEDATTLKTKVKNSLAENDNPEGDSTIRSLRKRLRRVQRKIRTNKRREEHQKSKKVAAEA